MDSKILLLHLMSRILENQMRVWNTKPCCLNSCLLVILLRYDLLSLVKKRILFISHHGRHISLLFLLSIFLFLNLMNKIFFLLATYHSFSLDSFPFHLYLFDRGMMFFVCYYVFAHLTCLHSLLKLK